MPLRPFSISKISSKTLCTETCYIDVKPTKSNFWKPEIAAIHSKQSVFIVLLIGSRGCITVSGLKLSASVTTTAVRRLRWDISALRIERFTTFWWTKLD